MDNSINTPRYASMGLLELVTWGVVLAAAVVPATVVAEVDTQVSLKLDYDLVPKIGAPGLDSKALARSNRAPELQSRVLKVQDQVEALIRENQQKVRLLQERQRMVSSIRGVVAAQDQMIGVLRTEISRPPPVAAAPPPPAAMPEPPPAPAVAMPAPTAAMPSPPAPMQIGPVQIPGWLQPWLVEGALGIVIVALLGLTLHARAAARAKEAELAALTSGVPAVPSVAEPAPPTEMPESAQAAPPTEMPEPAEPAAPLVPRPREPEPAALQPISPEAAGPPEVAPPEPQAAQGDSAPEGPTIFNIEQMPGEEAAPGVGSGTRPGDATDADQLSETATQDSEFDPDDVDFLFEVFGEDEESLEKTRDKSADKS